MPALYGLYAQVSLHTPVLARFGEDIFRNGTGNFDEPPMDLPVGPDYVLGPGDGLSIELWGGVSQHLQRVVDREGRVALPEAGAVQVTGRSLGEVQQLVQSVLRGEFRDVHADVSLARLRTVRVYVVGDVLRPGAYDVSSLSTRSTPSTRRVARLRADRCACCGYTAGPNWWARSTSTICCCTGFDPECCALRRGTRSWASGGRGVDGGGHGAASRDL